MKLFAWGHIVIKLQENSGSTLLTDREKGRTLQMGYERDMPGALTLGDDSLPELIFPTKC